MISADFKKFPRYLLASMLSHSQLELKINAPGKGGMMPVPEAKKCEKLVAWGALEFSHYTP